MYVPMMLQSGDVPDMINTCPNLEETLTFHILWDFTLNFKTMKNLLNMDDFFLFLKWLHFVTQQILPNEISTTESLTYFINKKSILRVWQTGLIISVLAMVYSALCRTKWYLVLE